MAVAEEFIESDDLEGLQLFLAKLGASRSPSCMGEILESAVTFRSRRCFRWLLKQPEFFVGIGKEQLAKVAGYAAAEGLTYYVRSIVETGADLALPGRLKCCHGQNSLLLVTGAMISMKPEIVELARDCGAFARSHTGCLADAAEDIGGRHKYLIHCLTIFGQVLLERFETEGGAFVPVRHLVPIIRKLQEGKGVTEESIALGDQLESFLDPEDAVYAELMIYVQKRRPRKMWKVLRQLPKEKLRSVATRILPHIAFYANDYYDQDPRRGWRDVEKLLDLGAGVDGTDNCGRTILMYAVHMTKGQENLIRRLVGLGANVNATSEELSPRFSESGELKIYSGRSVLDFCMLDPIERIENDYAPLLRSLGAKPVEELLEERGEGH